jgi:imidazole glycerol-phosphate synthase subunit HisF
MSIKNPYKQGGMFEGASHLIFENAKQLRKNMTYAETVLWMHLKNGIEGLKFRRQHPIGRFIADFYCHKLKLIIEVDGSVHSLETVQENDEIREKELSDMGYNIIRFTNEQVTKQADEVILSIKEKAQTIINSQNQNASSKNGV